MSERISLAPPAQGGSDLLVIAGEHSGDEHASRMVAELKEARPELRVCAIGGQQLAAAGAELLFDLTRHAVVGLVEVLRNYGLFRSLLHAIIAWIKRYRPGVVCFVDYPGFNLRLAERLFKLGLARRAGGEISLFYFIAPQIWAWKSERRFSMARYLDGLAVIFPFEVANFSDTSLPVEFVGHPFVQPRYELSLTYDPEAPLLLLPGSRRQPVARIFPVMADAFHGVLQESPTARALVVFPSSRIRRVLERVLADRPELRNRIALVRSGSPVRGCGVITSSGTMSLACGLAGIPGVIAYKAHPVTYLWARRMIRVSFLGIANILLDTPIYPEFIQGRATPQSLCDEIIEVLRDAERRSAAEQAQGQLRVCLSSHGRRSPGVWLADAMDGT